MSLVKWEPGQEMSRLREEMDRFFGQALRPWHSNGDDAWLPEVDMREQGDNLIIEANLPGVKKEAVDISTTRDSITISGHSEQEKEEKKENYFSRERRTGRFVRTLFLPTPVDAAKAEATFDNGTVKITLPKAPGATVQKITLK